MKDILNMSEIDLNIKCARFMGEKLVQYPNVTLIEKNVIDGEEKYGYKPYKTFFHIPEYSKSLDLMYQVEENIKEKGLQKLYLMHLSKITNSAYKLWNIIHASPLDRLKAVLLTIQEGE